MNRDDEYSFMQETFKDEQLSPKKVVAKVFKWLSLGVVFGVAACLSFYALKPWAENVFREEPEEVELSNDDMINEPEEPVEEIPKEEPEEEEQSVEQKQELTLDDYYI